ncbi:ZrgA family zinc uptake protein [Microbulbifer sp. PSTR4-B]|uniref:ZrgA family zinc uptake protein n=1 Tax=unclassified Microbulbifer TaxID=2619833 RepID=UPI00403AEE91
MKSAGVLLIALSLVGSVVGDMGSHVHGKAMMYLVAETDKIRIELESPLSNLVGFEHAPRNDTQK